MKISIITVVYNSSKTLACTIQSIQQQTYHDIEYIVIDGGSNDGTMDVVERYKDDITHIVSEPDNGIYDAMNKGLRLCTGDYVAFLNSDDFYVYKDVVKMVVEQLSKTGAKAAYGDLLYVDRNETDHIYRYWKAGKLKPWKFLFGYMIPHPTLFVKKTVLDKFGYFKSEFNLSADYEMMIRLFYKHRISSCYVPMVLTKMRLGGAGNIAFSSRVEASLEDRKAWRSNDIEPYFFTTLLKPVIKVLQLWLRPSKKRFKENIAIKQERPDTINDKTSYLKTDFA